jgi:hypothetical protein
MLIPGQASSFPTTNFGSSPTGTSTQAPSPLPQPPAPSSGQLTPVEKSEIAKNNAKKWLYRVTMVAGAVCMSFITGGVLVWLFTTSNSISSDLGGIKANINNIDTIISQLRDDKNRDVDRLQKEIDDLKQTKK